MGYVLGIYVCISIYLHTLGICVINQQYFIFEIYRIYTDLIGQYDKEPLKL